MYALYTHKLVDTTIHEKLFKRDITESDFCLWRIILKQCLGNKRISTGCLRSNKNITKGRCELFSCVSLSGFNSVVYGISRERGRAGVDWNWIPHYTFLPVFTQTQHWLHYGMKCDVSLQTTQLYDCQRYYIQILVRGITLLQYLMLFWSHIENIQTYKIFFLSYYSMTGTLN